jgi:hypothetical protein
MPAPDRRLNNWIEGFLQYTDNTEPPYLFRKWTAISCIASALQRKVKVDWGAKLTFYPNLYIVLVGPSATGKGTAMNPGLALISEISNIRLSAQATSLQALIRHLKDTNLNDIDLETGKSIMHSSLTIFSKEFTVFLGYHNRELMAALCDWYDCDWKWVYETIIRKKEEIMGVWVNLLAGTTPDLIQSSLPIESIGGGLTSRIIFVFEEKPGKLVTLPTETPAERELYTFLASDLEKIYLLSGSYKWTKAFTELWDDWCRKAAVDPPFHSSKFDGYLGRRRVHLMKLSMIWSAAHGEHGLVITEDDLAAAIVMLDEVENKMGMTFKGVGQSDLAGMMYKATMYLKSSPTGEVPVHEFVRYFEGDLDKIMMDRVLNTLIASKIINLIKKPQADAIIKVIDREGGDEN